MNVPFRLLDRLDKPFLVVPKSGLSTSMASLRWVMLSSIYTAVAINAVNALVRLAISEGTANV